MAVKKVGILTAGGLAPCLSSAVGGLIERYTEMAPEIEIICYRSGYKGLLLGDAFTVTPSIRERAPLLHRYGGSPIGNSRVKLTNVADCEKRGLVATGQDPRRVAAEQLQKHGVDVLHTIGGDDTNTAAADLAQYLEQNGYGLTVIGLPKTVDNDVTPIRQTLGASTAAQQGAQFFCNVVAESSSNPRTLIIHEVMGRNCGWLTAATARAYLDIAASQEMMPELGLRKEMRTLHAVYLPEMQIDIDAEIQRLKSLMDERDCVNIFFSEGAGIETIVAELQAAGEEVKRDAFGHVKLDTINPGQWFSKKLTGKLKAEKTLVQKSGYFARSAPANGEDLRLIKGCVDLAVQCALEGKAGVIGHDEAHDGKLRAIEFSRIQGGKAFNLETPWFAEMIESIGQPAAKPAAKGSGAHG